MTLLMLTALIVSVSAFPSSDFKRKWSDEKQGRDVWFDCREPTHDGSSFWFAPPNDAPRVLTDCLHVSECDEDLAHGYWGWSHDSGFSWCPTLPSWSAAPVPSWSTRPSAHARQWGSSKGHHRDSAAAPSPSTAWSCSAPSSEPEASPSAHDDDDEHDHSWSWASASAAASAAKSTSASASKAARSW